MKDECHTPAMLERWKIHFFLFLPQEEPYMTFQHGWPSNITSVLLSNIERNCVAEVEYLVLCMCFRDDNKLHIMFKNLKNAMEMFSLLRYVINLPNYVTLNIQGMKNPIVGWYIFHRVAQWRICLFPLWNPENSIGESDHL